MLFLGVVFSNTLIGTVQELRAKRTLGGQRLKLLNAPAARVLREGQEKTCRMETAGAGDLVVARAGDQILADGQVVEGQGAANESLLTGVSDAIGKISRGRAALRQLSHGRPAGLPPDPGGRGELRGPPDPGGQGHQAPQVRAHDRP